MPDVLSDTQIARLLAERKPELDERELLGSMKLDQNQQKRASLSVTGAAGSEFVLHIRQNSLDAYDFSVILAFAGGGRPINLRRHNGPTHPHSNKLEGTRVDFVPHVHTATERYQEAGYEAEGYAERTSEFSDVASALRSMIRVAGFDPAAQGTIL